MSYEFSNKESYELINDGEYEVILDTAEIKETNDKSKKYISCKFVIRSDVDQPSQGRIIFDNIWEDKERPSQFDHRKLQKLLLVQGPTGTYSFAGDEELVQFINGLSMIVKIEKKDADEYHDEAYNQIKYCSYKPSKAHPKSLGPVTNSANALKSAGVEFNVIDDDLPF